MPDSLPLVVRTALACCLTLAVARAQEPDDPRFVTDRTSPVELALPAEEGVFQFVVFGDRTGGPPEGVAVLEQAVRDANLLAPDFVMTVGDLVEGYNEREAWLEQAAEFRAIMAKLRCPWFPVAGNHDIYWRGEGRRPELEHEGDYESTFGPLWYAFRHHESWFVVLYSDEGDPSTGRRDFRDPAAQRMSAEQLAWLTSTLERARDARHVFVFLHHPRWHGGGYGDDWERVHRVLRDAGNVSAVFAGHIHHMQYDGVRDGIEYFTIASVGAWLEPDLEPAGHLHEVHLVTVRDERIDVVAFPVGSAIDPRSLTAEVTFAGLQVRDRLVPSFAEPIVLEADGSVRAVLTLELSNPTRFPLGVELVLDGGDPAWTVDAAGTLARLAPGEKCSAALPIARDAFPPDGRLRVPELVARPRLALSTGELRLSDRRYPLPLDLSRVVPAAPPRGTEGVLELDGSSGWATIASGDLELPDGAFTLECRFRADRFASRQGLINKTEGAEFGFFVNRGRPEFLVHLGGKYVGARAEEALPADGAWHHIAGVYDGKRVSLFVDGELRARRDGTGRRGRNDLPLVIGGDVDSRGAGASLLAGGIDEVRLSSGARYSDGGFVPARRHEPDADTLLLLHFDGELGPWFLDSSARQKHALRIGTARVGLVASEEPSSR